MRQIPGNKAPSISLPNIDGNEFSSTALEGRSYLISFYRFATCPFCNMRIRQLINTFESFGPDCQMIAIFESPLPHLQKHTQSHQAPFPILSDVQKKYYQKFGIEKSFFGMIKGIVTRLPILVKGMISGYFPLPIKGSLIRMPADFLVDDHGIIQEVYYGKDEGDHMPLSQIQAFFSD